MSKWALMLTVVLVGMVGTSFAGTYSGGTGTAEDPYQIGTAEDMQAIGTDPNNWDKHFVLIADIDLGQFDGKDGREKFNVIGTDYDHPFTGVFDGNGHMISNLTCHLFYFIDGLNAEVRNLGLIAPVAFGGALTVRLRTGVVSNCYAEGVTVNTGGGLIGENLGGTISSCHTSGSISGGGYPFDGGLVGVNGGMIADCYSMADVEGYRFAGGLVGSNGYGFLEGRIENCYVTGGIVSNWGIDGSVGGLVGYNSGTILRCYAANLVIGNGTPSGGLVGRHGGECETICDYGCITICEYYGTLEKSYWDVEASQQPNACGNEDEDPCILNPHIPCICGDINGRTASELMQQSTFTNWDFINVWNIGENQTYPYLRTHSAADLNKDKVVNMLDLGIMAEQWMENK